jgi:hypothetical protein
MANPSRRAFGLTVGYASSRAHNNETSRTHDDSTSRLCFHNSHGAFKSFAQAARIEGGLCEFARTTTTTATLTSTLTTTIIVTATISSRAHDNNTSRSGFHHKLKHGSKSWAMRVRPRTKTTTVPRVCITPTGSSKASCRLLGPKVGYASSRAHDNNDTNTNINNNYNNNNVFARARQQTGPVARVWLFIH